MMPKPGQYVKCVLKNNIIAEGTVKEWGIPECVLESSNDDSVLIIPHPTDDIILIKIISNGHKNIETSTNEDVKYKQELENKFEETYNEPSDNNDLRTKSLAELKIELSKQDKKIIANKLKDHFLNSSNKKVEYGYPGFFKKQSTE